MRTHPLPTAPDDLEDDCVSVAVEALEEMVGALAIFRGRTPDGRRVFFKADRHRGRELAYALADDGLPTTCVAPDELLHHLP